MKRLFAFGLLFVFLVGVISGCAPKPEVSPDDEPASDVGDQQIEILGPWGGLEQEALEKVIAPFEESTGIKVNYTGTRYVSVVLSRARSGNPPDFYISPLPSVTTELAKDNVLVALDSFMDMDKLNNAYAADWLGLASENNHLYGIFGPVSIKSIVWYSPVYFEQKGYSVPNTWDEMLALTEQMAADGVAPWSIAMGSGDATGWVGTDWIEDIMLRTVGPEVYDQWVDHDIPWTDQRVKDAWEIFGEIGLNEDYVFGGTSAELSIDFGDGADALYTDPPNAYMHRQALFLYDFIRNHFPDLIPGKDIDFFMLPSINPNFGTPALSAGEMLIMFRDTPANQEFMNYWADVEAQVAIAVHFGRLSANKLVPSSTYDDPLLQKGAELLSTADSVRFDGSDLMPSSIGAGSFWKGVVDYVNGKDLDSVLNTIEEDSKDAY